MKRTKEFLTHPRHHAIAAHGCEFIGAFLSLARAELLGQGLLLLAAAILLLSEWRAGS